MMDQLETLIHLFEVFQERLRKAQPKKRSVALGKAVATFEALTKSLQPTQKEIKQELLTNRTAMKIREIWNGNKKLFDLTALARELGLALKKPSIDHIILGYYYPTDRLKELAIRLEGLEKLDPSIKEKQIFQEWRGRLRSKTSQAEIVAEIVLIADRDGVEILRRFAEHLDTKDLSGSKKLSKKAAIPKLVDAVAAHLWKEKMRSKAQEGS
jgi:hypothetical protein